MEASELALNWALNEFAEYGIRSQGQVTTDIQQFSDAIEKYSFGNM